MRLILTLIALTCMPAFCQDDAAQKLNDNLKQRLAEILNAQAQISANTTAVPRPLRITVGLPAPQLCSIPLLKATGPGKPVPMPGLKPRNPTAIQRSQDRMKMDRMNIVAPAPACQAPAPATKP